MRGFGCEERKPAAVMSWGRFRPVVLGGGWAERRLCGAWNGCWWRLRFGDGRRFGSWRRWWDLGFGGDDRSRIWVLCYGGEIVRLVGLTVSEFRRGSFVDGEKRWWMWKRNWRKCPRMKKLRVDRCFAHRFVEVWVGFEAMSCSLFLYRTLFMNVCCCWICVHRKVEWHRKEVTPMSNNDRMRQWYFLKMFSLPFYGSAKNK